MLKKLAHLKGVCFLGAVEAKAIDRVFVFQVLQRLERGRLRPYPQQKASRHLPRYVVEVNRSLFIRAITKLDWDNKSFEDKVAYVRFASIYLSFENIYDFSKIIEASK